MHGTITQNTEENVALVQQLQEAVKSFPGSLQVFPLDVLSDEYWRELMKNIEYVFYLAFPRVRFKGRDNKNLNISVRAVDGARRVVQYCQRSKTVKKLIFTSCYMTLTEKFEDDRIYNETHWNTTETEQSDSYTYGKVRSEQIALEFCSDSKSKCNFQFVSLLPGIMWGPPLGNTLHSLLSKFL